MTLLAKVEKRVKAFTKHLPPPPPPAAEEPGETRRQKWLATARASQLPPQDADWLTWLILAGRGFGKTRTGAETIAEWAREIPGGRFALIGQTFADGRDVMVEGDSGLLSVLDESELRGGSVDTAWNRSMGELFMENGSQFKIYSSEQPRKLRGPQHHGAWGDEPATWNDADRGTADDTTWSNLLFGLRLGTNPRVVMTGTPRPNRLVRELMKADDTHLTKGSTYDNLGNLAATFRKKVIAKYEGTRLGRQELEGLVLDDTPGALWHSSLFEREGFRVSHDQVPELVRVCVAVDPQASQSDDSAETGIVTVGLDREGHFWVIADDSDSYSPVEWATTALQALDDHSGDAIVPERNNGGDMVEQTIRNLRRNAPVRTVWASRGKATRAEPVSLLYEQGKVHHVGVFPKLEDQMTTWVPGQTSPDRMDALVWAITWLMTPPPAPAKVTTTRPRSYA